MKYAFMEKHALEFTIKAMARVLKVSRSGFYEPPRVSRRPVGLSHAAIAA